MKRLKIPAVIVLLFGLAIIGTVVFLRAGEHDGPIIEVSALSDAFPQPHVASDGKNVYYYDQKAGGLCLMGPRGETSLFAVCDTVQGIACGDGDVFFRDGDTLRKVSSDGPLLCTAPLSIPQYELEPVLLAYHDSSLIGLCDTLEYVDADAHQLSHAFSPSDLTLLGRCSATPDLGGAWRVGLRSDQLPRLLTLQGPADRPSQPSFSYETEAAFGDCDYKLPMRRELPTGCLVCIFKRGTGQKAPEEYALKRYSGDVLLVADLTDGSIRLIAETGAGERIVYADENVYVIYRLQTLTYDFYDRNTGDQIGQLKQEKNPFRAFHDYTYETAGRFLFLYEGDALLERIDMKSIRFLSD